MVDGLKTFGLAFALFSAVMTCALLPFVSPPDPGGDLLHVAKALADSGRVDDPGTVAGLLQMKLVRSNHFVSNSGFFETSVACPAGTNLIENDYAVTGNNWFRTLPIGKMNMRLPNIAGDLGYAGYHNPGNPKFSYNIETNRNVADGGFGPGLGFVNGSIGFESIPSYACIGFAQIKAIFPQIEGFNDILPMGGRPYFVYLASGQYKSDFGRTSAEDQSKPYSVVSFLITRPLFDKSAPPQPECLEDMYVGAAYSYGPTHRPDIGP